MSCQLCGGIPIPFWAVEGVPTSSCVVFDTPQQARNQAVGDLSVEVCPECGFIQNGAFQADAVDYLAPYEESQASSPTFRRFAEATIDQLLDRYPLSGGTALEVGCGKAEWLAMMCKAGDMTGIGIDPGYLPGRVPSEDEERFEVITEFFGPETDLTGNLVACRHTLEHVPNAREFTGWLGEAAARTDGSVLFIEVPDTDRIIHDGAFWDLYYEHCSYFTTTSLHNLAAVTGITAHDVRKAYGEQYLLFVGTPGAERRPLTDPAETVEGALAFGARADATIEYWKDRLADADHVALWGATSKTVGFISATSAEPVVVVDINPAKQETYLPGSGVRIVEPAVLTEVKPDLVIAMNPIYVEEIGASLTDLGMQPKLTALGAQHANE